MSDAWLSTRPWHRAYWLGEVDPRPLAAMRIGLGLMVLSDLVTRMLEMRTFLTDDGMLPRGFQTERWAWSLLDLTGSRPGVALVLGAAFVAALAFTLGYRTRLATIATWALLLSIQNRNRSIGDSGDDIARIFLAWSIFTDVGAVWSLDVKLGRRPRAPAFALGARLMQGHLAICYLSAGFLKMRGTWLDGDGIYQVLQLTKFVRPGGAWMLGHPALCELANFSTLAIESSLAVFILTPWLAKPARGIAFLLSTGLQLGILLTMRVGMFTGTMLVAQLILVPPSWFDALAPAEPLAEGHGAPFGRLAPWFAAFLVAHLAMIGLVDVTSFMPGIVERELAWLGFSHGGALFTRPLPISHWRVDAVLADGRKLDILPLVAPELDPPVGYWHSRWHKFTFRSGLHLEPLGAYLCRRYAETVGEPRLISFDLQRDVTMPVHPGEAPVAPKRELLLAQRCP